MVKIPFLRTILLSLILILTGLMGPSLSLLARETDTFSFQESWLEGGSHRFANKKDINVAVIQDGPSPDYDRLVAQIESENKRLLEGEKNLSFIKQGYNGGWNPGGVIGLVGKALNDPAVDVVLTVGLLSTQAAANPALFLTKPVIGTLIDRSEVLTLPIAPDGTSAKNDFTFVVLNLPILRDFEAFYEMVPYRRVDVLVDQLIFKHLQGIQGKKAEIEKKLGIQIRIVPGGAKAEEYLRQLSRDTEAVMVGVLPRLSDPERKRLINGINGLGIPSLSLLGYPDVKLGVLGGLTPDTFEQTARRAALDLQQVVLDFDVDDLSVMMPIQARLLINGRTAKKIGYSPDFFLLRTATFTDLDLLGEGESLTLNRALALAGERNVDLQISRAESEVSRTQSLIQRSFLLPQGEGGIVYQQIDRDRAVASLGSLPQRQTTGNLNFSSVIFDDPLLSEFRTSKKNYKSAQALDRETRFDVMLEGGGRFLNLLSALALLRIEGENLNLTLENLETAQLRFEVGMAGLDEVYRWEAQEAEQRGQVFDRISQVDNAMVALNQALNFNQAKKWRPADISREDAQEYFFGKELKGVIGNFKDLNRLGGKLVEDAFRNSNTIQAIVYDQEGREIRLGQKKRRFYTPSLGTAFDYAHEFQANRPGQTVPAQGDRNFWAFTGQVNLPLFQGGFRIHEMAQAKADLYRISSELTRALQLVEQDTRSQLNDLGSSSPNLFFTQRAAERAKLNLGIVRDKYAQGRVGIIDLIDAQNQFVTREQQAALAVYRYLGDMLELQRAVSWYAVDHTAEEKQQFVEEILNYMKNSGGPESPPSPDREMKLDATMGNP